MSEYDYRAPTLAEAHAQWHSIHGQFAICDLDCGAGEGYAAEQAEQQALDDQARWEREQDYLAMYSPVEQGYYDDDPSPYAGDYSEM